VRPCDLFAGGAIELLLGAAERCFDEGDLEREREEEVDQPLLRVGDVSGTLRVFWAAVFRTVG